MSKQKLNKLISVLLALTICSATVFGCLITVNAAETPSCEIANGVVKDSTTATVDVTFTAPNGIAAGEFAVDKTAENFTGVTATVIDGTPLDSATDGAFDAADFTITHASESEEAVDLNGALEVILFETASVDEGNGEGHLKLYTSVTLQLTYTLVDGSVVKGTDIPVSISDIAITGESTVISGMPTSVEGTIETGCDHIITVSGSPIRTDAENGYAVYENGVCSICGENFGYQVVPTAEIETETIIYNVNNSPSDGSFITAAAEGVGDTAENPYIISTVSDLIYLVKSATTATTTDKYFKIDDSIDTMVLQSEDTVKAIGNYFSSESTVEAGLEALENMTAAQAEEYFTSSNSKANWNVGGSEYAFAGNIDFNGVTIYGLKGYLFNYINAGSTVKNLTVKGAYVASDIAAVIAARGNGTGTITFENCTIANSTVVCQRKNGAASFGGVMIGFCGQILNINNCLVYGNTAKHQGYYDTITGYDITYGLFGGAASNTTVSNSIILDCVPHATYFSYSATRDVVCSKVYTNVIGQTITSIDFESDGATKIKYTVTPEIDAEGNYTFNAYKYNLTTDVTNGPIDNKKSAGSVLAVNDTDVKGVKANSVISSFDAGVWAYTANSFPTPLAAFADAVSTESSIDFALKAVNLTYADDGSFSINFHYEPPYAGFEPELYVAKATENGKFRKLTATVSSMAGTVLSENAIMYTLSGLSATEIG
ncbi:MAG: hypothetical protein ACI4U6_05795, partial [Acutalibacteraceae bacterium]